MAKRKNLSLWWTSRVPLGTSATFYVLIMTTPEAFSGPQTAKRQTFSFFGPNFHWLFHLDEPYPYLVLWPIKRPVGTPGAPKRSTVLGNKAHLGPMGFSRGPRQPRWSPNKPDVPHPSAFCRLECHMCLQGHIGSPYFSRKGPKRSTLPWLLQFFGPILGQYCF